MIDTTTILTERGTTMNTNEAPEMLGVTTKERIEEISTEGTLLSVVVSETMEI